MNEYNSLLTAMIVIVAITITFFIVILTISFMEEHKEACKFLIDLGYKTELKSFPNARCFVNGEVIYDMEKALQFHTIQQLKKKGEGVEKDVS